MYLKKYFSERICLEAAASETLGPGEREAKRPEQTRAAPAEVWTVVAGVLQVCAFYIFLATSSRVLDMFNSHEVRVILKSMLIVFQSRQCQWRLKGTKSTYKSTFNKLSCRFDLRR